MSAKASTITLSSKSIFMLLACTTMVAACSSHPHPHQIPSWGGGDVAPPVGEAGNTYSPPVQAAQAEAPVQFSGRTTFTQGCTGGFSVRDARTNREISSGRAYNSGQGLIALDSAGRQVRAVSSLGGNTSVLFLPDCNCRQGGNAQTGAIAPNHQFAAQAPSAASCSAS
jgi:hypothetical protein